MLLRGDFGIEYVPNESLGIHLDSKKVQLIQEELEKYKRVPISRGSTQRALVDAEVMLTIHEIRDRDNELATTGIFGYKTWWLSSDVTTQQAAVAVAGEKYSRTCYMRPDFLYNYISLAPTKGQIDQAYEEIFPSLLGVNISFGLPSDVTKTIHKFVKEHSEHSQTRIGAILRELADDLKQNPDNQNSGYANQFLEGSLE